MEVVDVVLGIVVNDKGEILLQKKTNDYKNYPGQWNLFGGRAESDNMKNEMERELKEEIGIEIPIKSLFDFADDNARYHIFLSRLDNIEKVSIGEGAGVAFFSKEEIDKLKIIPGSSWAIKTFLRGSY
jgi:8-oxo-dGTP pyrophosphatase MutT (NUDIX family)